MKTISEFVLYRVDGDVRTPLYSDPERGLVDLHRLDEFRKALAEGRARPVLVVTERRCSYPTNAEGVPLAMGSTCDEIDVVDRAAADRVAADRAAADRVAALYT